MAASRSESLDATRRQADLSLHARAVSLDDIPTPAVASHEEEIRSTRVCPASNGFGKVTFEPKDIELLLTQDARLNDTCINGCATLLHAAHFGANSSPFAVLSTHDLPRIRYSATDEDLWRNAHRSSYWEKAARILPTHRPSAWGHWVLSSTHFDTRRILLFGTNSLATRFTGEGKLDALLSYWLPKSPGRYEID